MVDLIHIDEDSWALRNLYPLAAESHVLGDMKAATAADERNRDPTGFGWSDVHIITPPSISYLDMELRLGDAAEALEPIMPRVKRFYATASAGFEPGKRDPFGSYDEDAWCFGRGVHCFMKLDVEGDLVKTIWFNLSSDDPSDIAALRRSIEAINKLVPSVVSDYLEEMVGRAGDSAFLDRYLDPP